MFNKKPKKAKPKGDVGQGEGGVAGFLTTGTTKVKIRGGGGGPPPRLCSRP